VSADGLQTAVSQRPDRPIADQLAAIASDVASLCQGAARSFDAGTLKQTVVEMERGFLFVMAISDGSLVVLAAMDLLQVARHRRGGGDDRLLAWEFSAGLTDWEQAPAPARIGKRVVEGVFQRRLLPERAGLVNNLMHPGLRDLLGRAGNAATRCVQGPR
jgi:hypothetical protein